MSLFLNPAILFPLIWLAVIRGSETSNMMFYPFSELFYQYMLVAFVVFSGCSVLATLASKKLMITRHLINISNLLYIKLSPERLFNVYLILMIISLFFQCLDHASIAGSSWWSPQGLIIYRIAVTDMGQSSAYGFISILNYFFFSAGPMLLLYKGRVATSKIILMLIFLLAFIYLSTARASLFTIMLIGSIFYTHYKPRIKVLLIIGFILFSLFGLIGSLVGKNVNNAFWIYLFSPAHALDQIIYGSRFDDPSTFYTFAPLHSVLINLGWIAPQEKIFSNYETPYLTNVFTVFGPYILDYGLYLSFAFVALFGFVSGFIYGARQKFPEIPFLAFLSSLSLTILVLGIFHDYYSSAGYVWLSLFFGCLLFPRELA